MRLTKTTVWPVIAAAILLASGSRGFPAPDPSPAQTATETAETIGDPIPAPDERGQAEPIFNEITLSEQGVMAVDTAGFEWFYDFETGRFVEDEPEYSGERPIDVWTRPDELAVEERCTEELRIQPFEKTVLVGYEEYVDDNIIAYGRVTVRGWVRGDVTSLKDRVLITETGQVDGDVEAPRVEKRPGGLVLGTITETGSPLDFPGLPQQFTADGLVVAVVMTFFIMFVGFLAVSLMPKQLERLRQCISHYSVKAFLLGFFFILFMPAFLVLVTITLVGIVLLPFFPLVYACAMLLGLVSFGHVVGKGITRKYLAGQQSVLFQTVMGVFVFMLLWILVAILLGQSGDTAQGFGIFLLVVAIVVSVYPVCTGVGAVILTRFGFRDYVSWKERRQSLDKEVVAPAPPPLKDFEPEVAPPPTRPETSEPTPPPIPKPPDVPDDAEPPPPSEPSKDQ